MPDTMMSDHAGQVAGAGPDEAALADIRRDGFLVARGFFDAAATADLLAWTDELYDAQEQPGRHWVYREDRLSNPGARVVQRIENFCPFHAGFNSLIERGRLTAWSGALLGGPVVLFKDKINFKMPGAPGFTPHQDQAAGWTRYAPLFITAMVSLDATTRENGCLEMAAGRHREGLLGQEWSPLDRASLELVPVPTAPGDVIFFDSFAPHASEANFSDLPRRVLYLTYNLARDGDQRARYYADKRAAFPPDIERDGSTKYVFRV